MKFREDRLNGELQRMLSQIISKLKDPRITEMVSVLSVSVAKDLKTAKVTVSIFGSGDEEKKQTTFAALCRCAGFIRKELSREFQDLRTVPELTFILDTSQAYSERIEKLIEEIKKNDNSGN